MTATNTRFYPLLGVVILSVGGLLGCGDGNLTTYPVEGTVTFRGQPIAHAKVTFKPTDPAMLEQGVLPTGETDDSGRYTLQTYEPGDGAPPGNYQVAVAWYRPTGRTDDPEMAMGTMDAFQGRYSNPEQTGITRDVQAGDNQLEAIDIN